jgi:Tfp pilus assembly protein PilF
MIESCNVTDSRQESVPADVVGNGNVVTNDPMSRIWKAAGFAGSHSPTTSTDRYIARGTNAKPLRPYASVTDGGAIDRRRRLQRKWAAVVAVPVLLAGGVAIGRYAFPNSSPSSVVAHTAREDALFTDALNQQKAGKLRAAEAGFTSVLQIDPLNYTAYYNLGVIYQQTNRSVDATLAYEKALIINTKFQPALFNLAILDSTGDPQAAITLYKRIQQLGPQNPSAVAFNLGLVYRETGSVAAGNAQLRYAVSLDPALRSKIPHQYLPITA